MRKVFHRCHYRKVGCDEAGLFLFRGLSVLALMFDVIGRNIYFLRHVEFVRGLDDARKTSRMVVSINFQGIAGLYLTTLGNGFFLILKVRHVLLISS